MCERETVLFLSLLLSLSLFLFLFLFLFLSLPACLLFRSVLSRESRVTKWLVADLRARVNSLSATNHPAARFVSAHIFLRRVFIRVKTRILPITRDRKRKRGRVGNRERMYRVPQCISVWRICLTKISRNVKSDVFGWKRGRGVSRGFSTLY